VAGLGWSNGREGNAGCSVATGTASRVRQVKGEDPDKKGIHRSLRLGVGRGADNPNHKKYVLLKGF